MRGEGKGDERVGGRARESEGDQRTGGVGRRGGGGRRMPVYPFIVF